MHKYIMNQFRIVKMSFKAKENYLLLFSGIFLVLGTLIPALNFTYYLAFIIPLYLSLKKKLIQSNIFFFLFPYFLMLGFGVWHNIFPFFLGIILAILLGELISRLMAYSIRVIDNKTLNIFVFPSLLFLFDFLFQEVFFIRKILMVPLLTGVYNHQVILKASSIFGSHFVLFMILVMILLLVKFISNKKMIIRDIIILFTTIIFVFLPSFLKIESNVNQTVKVAVVQSEGNDISQTSDYFDYLEQKFNNYRDMISNVEADIYVLPETAIGVYDSEQVKYLDTVDRMTNLAKEKDALIVGFFIEGSSVTKSKDDSYLSALLFSKDGILGKTSKRNLVPFSETSEYSKGTSYETIDTIYGDIGISICFDVNDRTIGKLKENGAEIILSPFNDYGMSEYFHRVHLYNSIINATKYNVSIAVSNYNGISALIDDDGNILKSLDINEDGVLTYDMHLTTQKSMYMNFGRYLEIIFTISILGLIGYSTFNYFKRREKAC